VARFNQDLSRNTMQICGTISASFITYAPNIKISLLKASNISPFWRQPLSLLSLLFPAQDFDRLDADQLNANLLEKIALSTEKNTTAPARVKTFVCQDSMSQDFRYYEQIIFEENIIPTRKESWHDFFNGIIWLQFPQTKTYLNCLHISEIKTHGLNPRTKVRHHITHFDECGVVLFIKGQRLFTQIQQLFAAQAWTSLFCELREEWNTCIFPVVFGHANLEMMLSPFIGLTGKVLLIQIEDMPALNNIKQDNEPSDPNQSNITLVEPHVWDSILLQHIEQNQTFFASKPFYPLPLLGVPGWHFEKQDADFYANTDYFMPKRQRKAGAD
jgi:hypothetical protein